MAATTEHEPTVEVRTRTSRRPSLHARFPACGTGKSFRVFHSRLTREGHPSLPNATLTDTPSLFTNRRSTTTTRVRRRIPTAMRKRVRPETRARPHPNERPCNCQQRGLGSMTTTRAGEGDARGSSLRRLHVSRAGAIDARVRVLAFASDRHARCREDRPARRANRRRLVRSREAIGPSVSGGARLGRRSSVFSSSSN